ncbi:hypothetical protein CPB84DRAFT_1840939 [Gymnopilus junonius]|uniref:CASTOR ACT domain-containing protein n=1 Tax=Gymnopilus junonius TaxID=109634 RepID=A0A9P5TV31_GYMJU|nr:hypothetical protein CPB84DRAFT_1840939 [Gymnopilus junonius]
MQVTISLLPVSLSLLHIPRSRLESLSHPIIRQLLHPNPSFLTITCNEIELSVFAEHHLLQDFESIARKDRHRQRSRSGSASSRKGVSQSVASYEPVEISYEKWSVLQIDSHSDQTDNSGSRIYDLSAPLATAGISILYQSSYTSDFIFVKESRLQEAMDLFASAGFHLYSSEPHSPISPSLSPGVDDRSSVDFTLQSAHGAVLTRNMEASELPSSSLKPGETETLSTGQQSPRKSHSPTSGEVRILHPDLACVGLSEELGVDYWGLKLIKLVAFPDLIPSHAPTSAKARNGLDTMHPFQTPVVDLSSASLFNSDASSSSSSSEDDGYFSHSPQNVSTTSLTSNTSRSYSDLQSLSCTSSSLYQSPSKHFVSHLTPLSPITPKAKIPPLSVSTETSVHALTTSHSKRDSYLPFFTFTRTPEGSSLTTDVHVLAALFPPQERHMVICSGELDAADLRLASADSSDEEDEAGDDFSHSLKCLQIDLRRFGLDKHGLVSRFSRVLEENGINHMYSSTFKTANLLVDRRDAVRAQSLLRAC